jgi:hypothetical protein
MKHILLVFLIVLLLVIRLIADDTSMEINYKTGSSKGFTVDDIDHCDYTKMGGSWFLNVHTNSGLEGISISSIENIIFSENSNTKRMVIESIDGKLDTIPLNTLYEIIFTAPTDVETDYYAATDEYLRCSPNPFGNKISITFYLNKMSNVYLSVFDQNGKEVAQLLSGLSMPGLNKAEWNGKDRSGCLCSPGYYIVVLKENNQFHSKKILLSK